MNPSTESDGVYDVKHIEGYSIEQELDNKTFFLEEGTFKFYDQTSPSNPDTIMGRILEGGVLDTSPLPSHNVIAHLTSMTITCLISYTMKYQRNLEEYSYLTHTSEPSTLMMRMSN